MSGRLLDLSRLVSRLGGGPATGIDRVERAWLRALLARDEPLFGLVRTGAGYCLLDRAGAARVLALTEGAALPDRPDPVSRLSRPRDARRARAETAIRPHAIARALPFGLGPMLRRHLPPGTVCLNMGHSNLSRRMFSGLRAAGIPATVLIHDVIPLDHPEFCRPGIPAAFRRRMRRVAQGAALVVYNSADTRDRAGRHFARWGRVPPGLVAHLGTDPPAAPDPAGLPEGLDLDRPFFLVLGTIEPRKNHVFLLDVWEELARRLPAADMPRLLIVGRRGWRTGAFAARLAASALNGQSVLELGGIDDGACAALMARARALLFPSLAEGFGLPLAEAMVAGTPVICSPLPVFREIAGDYPVYLATGDVYPWAEAIAARCAANTSRDRNPVPEKSGIPGWDDHVRVVLTRIARTGDQTGAAG
ncbi:MAG: glycosyltransferase family 1 protein [Gemmobacter sp.]